MSPFNIGDVVRLNSGSPDMTVQSIAAEGVGVAWSQDFAPYISTHTFPAPALTLVKAVDASRREPVTAFGSPEVIA